MKMGPGLFWGIVFILIGIGLIIKIVFNIDFPIFKTLIAFIFIYIGIKILVGGSFKPFTTHKTKSDVVFGESSFNGSEKNGQEYNVVFSKGTLDLRTVQFTDSLPFRVKINTVFGSSNIFLSKDIPVKIQADAVFSNATMPNGNSAAFGSNTFVSDSFDATKPYIDIDADVVFGELKFIRL
jgi:predicted membrane protein